MGVNPHAGTEQKASVAMEAERWRAARDFKIKTLSSLEREGKWEKWEVIVGKNGFWSFFSPKGWADMKRDYTNQEKLNVDIKEERKTNANINTKIEKIRAHIVIREQLKSLLVFPK